MAKKPKVLASSLPPRPTFKQVRDHNQAVRERQRQAHEAEAAGRCGCGSHLHGQEAHGQEQQQS